MSLRLALKKSLKERIPDAVPSSFSDGSDDETPRRRRQPRRAAAAAAAVEHISNVGELTPTSRKRKRRSVTSPKSYKEDSDEEYEEDEDDNEEYEDEFISHPKRGKKRHYFGRQPRSGKRINWTGPTKMDGSGVRRPACTFPGCDLFAQGTGKQVCKKHGAIVPEKKLCRVAGCKNKRTCLGLCVKHGAPVAKCKVKGCNSARINNGVCTKHGAIIKLCKVDGCPNKVQQGEKDLMHLVA